MKAKLIFLVKVVMLGGLMVLPHSYPALGPFTKFVSGVLDGLTFFLAGHVLLELGRLVVLGIYRRRHGKSQDYVDNFVVGINQLRVLGNVLIFAFAALISVNIKPWEVITSLSIVAAAIAIVSKDYISNMINGMILMFGQQLALGDIVKIGDQKGKIVDLNLLNIHMLNDDDDLIYIPNNAVLNANIINYSRRAVKKISIEFEVGLVHVQKVGELEGFLIEQLEDFKSDIIPSSFTLKIMEVKKDAIAFKFQYILKKANREKERSIRRTTVRGVVNFLGEKKEDS